MAPAARQADGAGRGVTLGEVSGVHGVRGWLKIYSHTDPREQILEYGPWLLTTRSGEREVEIRDGATSAKGVLAALVGIEDRDQAMQLVGAQISVPRERLPALSEGEVYWADLEGLQVINSDGAELGRISHLLETGANDVLVVRQGRRECLIPWLRGTVVRDVDLQGGVVTVDWEAET